MSEFFTVTFTFPTVVFTVLLGVTFCYWAMVILGGVGDVLDGGVDGAAEGIAEGAAEGIAEGAAEGAAEGIAEGAAEGAAEGVAEGATKAAIEFSVGGMFQVLRVRGVPLSLVLSLLFLWGWVISQFATALLLPRLSSLPFFVGATLTLLLSFVLALPLTTLVVRPLGHLVVQSVGPTPTSRIGKIVKIDTSRVDGQFGTGRFDDGEAGLILQVRCDRGNGLSRGRNALIVAYDSKRQVYDVTPVDDILPSQTFAKRSNDSADDESNGPAS